VAHLFEESKISIAVTTANGASGTTAIEGAAIDTVGFDKHSFIVAMGPITANAATSIKVQQSDDSDGDPDDWTDLTGTSQTIADDDDNQVFLVDVSRPRKRYVRLYVSRATQAATVGSAICVQTGARSRPVTHGSNVNTAEGFASPAEGTA
jgi:hypothetical protein